MAAFDDSFSRDRVIVMAAPNGARLTREDHAAVPLTAPELAECAASLLSVGAAVLHLHVRDQDGRHTLAVERYRAAQHAIRERVGDRLIVQITTESVGRYSSDEQMAIVRELKPEAVSLALRELVPNRAGEDKASVFFAWLRTNGVWPQYIVYSVDDLRRFETLCQRGVIPEPRPSCLFVLGRYADGFRGQLADLDALRGAVDTSEFSWSVCCFGPEEHVVMCAATEAGGHVRLGFENNTFLADGATASDNAELIARYVTAIESSGRRPATAEEVRAEWRS